MIYLHIFTLCTILCTITNYGSDQNEKASLNLIKQIDTWRHDPQPENEHAIRKLLDDPSTDLSTTDRFGRNALAAALDHNYDNFGSLTNDNITSEQRVALCTAIINDPRCNINQVLYSSGNFYSPTYNARYEMPRGMHNQEGWHNPGPYTALCIALAHPDKKVIKLLINNGAERSWKYKHTVTDISQWVNKNQVLKTGLPMVGQVKREIRAEKVTTAIAAKFLPSFIPDDLCLNVLSCLIGEEQTKAQFPEKNK